MTQRDRLEILNDIIETKEERLEDFLSSLQENLGARNYLASAYNLGELSYELTELIRKLKYQIALNKIALDLNGEE